MKLTLPSGTDVPVLLLLFNRPDHTEKLINALRTVKPKNIFVNIDGPRNVLEVEKVEDCKRLVASIDWSCEVRTHYNSSNLGCRDSVIGGINWFFQNCEAGIILEDDCIPSKSFFPFCALMLEKYANDERVMQVSGSNYVSNKVDCSNEYYFSAFWEIWGWATWRRAWEKFSLDLSGLDRMAGDGVLDVYTSSRHVSDWLLKGYLLPTQKPNHKIWSPYWIYAMIKSHAFSIVPPVNLIQNIGFDGQGANGSFESFLEYSKYETSEILELHEPLFFYPNRHFDKVRFQMIKRTDPFFSWRQKFMRTTLEVLKSIHVYDWVSKIYRQVKYSE